MNCLCLCFTFNKLFSILIYSKITWVWPEEPLGLVYIVQTDIGPSKVAPFLWIIRKYIGGSQDVAEQPSNANGKHMLKYKQINSQLCCYWKIILISKYKLFTGKQIYGRVNMAPTG